MVLRGWGHSLDTTTEYLDIKGLSPALGRRGKYIRSSSSSSRGRRRICGKVMTGGRGRGWWEEEATAGGHGQGAGDSPVLLHHLDSQIIQLAGQT